MWFKTVRVSENQRVLWFRDGNFEGVLTPGRYRFWKRLSHTSFESFDVDDVQCRLPRARYLVANHTEALEAHLDIKVLNEREVGLVRINGQARHLALPGEVLTFWRGTDTVSVETVDVTEEFQVPPAWHAAIQLSGTAMELTRLRTALQPEKVAEGTQTIVLVDGQVDRVLEPGRYAFWKLGRDVKLLSVDLRLQEVEVNGQEILTRDRVSLRINASLQYRVTEAVRAAVSTPDLEALAYRSVQFALRRTVAALTLDELLAAKAGLGDEVTALVAQALHDAGVAVVEVGLKDVILPGEMRTILNQVVEAEKRAEANAIRRRDETQDVRALANTARQLEGNPMMARLKELEALESVSGRVDSLNVYHGLDGVMESLVKLKPS